MSAARGKRLSNYVERHERRLKKSHAVGAARRSENTRPRTLDEVRATVRDAATQLGRYARKNDRKDFQAFALILEEIRRALTIQPWTRSDLAKKIREFERPAFRTEWRPDGTPEPTGGDAPFACYRVTHDGLSQLQQAVADRVKAGLLPAAGTPTPVTIDFREASARLRARRAERGPKL